VIAGGLLIGCGSRAEVLTTSSAASSEPAPPAPRTLWPGCPSNSDEIDAFFDQTLAGDACTKIGWCGGADWYKTCVAHYRDCHQGVMEAIDTWLLDCVPAGGLPAAQPATNWADCGAALDQGHTGEACVSADENCARPTPDPCCIELASCSSGVLLRYQICAPGCEQLSPDPAQPTLTECSSRVEFRAPCTGGFMCIAGYDAALPFTVALGDYPVAWCANGVVVGGRGLALE
jgi:hypothetical protein